jgi:biofilm PGA synthesis protein PgaD
MDISRSRYPSLNLKQPIIERPDLQTRGQRTVTGALTVAFWALWIYLWVPLLALLAWALGIQQAYKYMIALQGYHLLGHVLAIYAAVILVLGSILLAWAGYNIHRFGGRADKRSGRARVTEADIGRDLGQDERQIGHWQRARLLLVRYDDAGRLADVHRLVA